MVNIILCKFLLSGCLNFFNWPNDQNCLLPQSLSLPNNYLFIQSFVRSAKNHPSGLSAAGPAVSVSSSAEEGCTGTYMCAYGKGSELFRL